MAIIKGSPERLSQVGLQIQRTCEQNQELFRQMCGAVQGLQGEWQGAGMQRLLQDFSQVQSLWYQTISTQEALSKMLALAAAKISDAEARGPNSPISYGSAAPSSSAVLEIQSGAPTASGDSTVVISCPFGKRA